MATEWMARVRPRGSCPWAGAGVVVEVVAGSWVGGMVVVVAVADWEVKVEGMPMLSSVNLCEVVSVAMTCPIRRDLWDGLLESGARAVSNRAWDFSVGAAVVLLKIPRQTNGQVVSR